MVFTTVEAVENSIKTICQTKGIRVQNFFIDYDKLRSGIVTESQFFRILWENIARTFSDDEQRMLFQKYGDVRSGQRIINYAVFCKEIDPKFNGQLVGQAPESQLQPVPEFFGTRRTVRAVEPDMEAILLQLLIRMKRYYTYYGFSIRTAYKDFDTHNRAVVTESQFYRNYPGPPDVTAAEIELLVRKYQDPENEGLVNYMNLHNDLLAVRDEEAPITTSEAARLGARLGVRLAGSDGTRALSVDEQKQLYTNLRSVQDILERIRIAVAKFGIRTPDFFVDYDKLRSGLVTEAQFAAALTLAVGRQAQLVPDEVRRLAEFYRDRSDAHGKVDYRALTNWLETGYNVAHLEKNVQRDPSIPPAGSLYKHKATLSYEEEERVARVLQQLADEALRRRLQLWPFFRDFDRSTAHTRLVTKQQFKRVIATLNLRASDGDMELVCNKFQDPMQKDSVNYAAFIEAVDPEFRSAICDTCEEAAAASKSATGVRAAPGGSGGASAKAGGSGELAGSVSDAECDAAALEDLLARIRHIVITKRLRVKDAMQDFDRLRTGSMSVSQFRRCLSTLGLSAIGAHELTDAQFALLAARYRQAGAPDRLRWLDFARDLEAAYSPEGLEREPTRAVPPVAAFLVPPPGTVEPEFMSDEQRALITQALERLRARVSERKVSCAPVFKSFDKHNAGVVSRQQFAQALTMLELHTTPAETAALAALFGSDRGVNYRALLEAIAPEPDATYRYPEFLATMRRLNAREKLPEKATESPFEAVLEKLQRRVHELRVRVVDLFADFDKLRSGHVPRATFRRALGATKLDLQESELSLLEDRYRNERDADAVDYARLVRDVESACVNYSNHANEPFEARQLHRKPLVTPDQMAARPEPALVQPADEERAKVEAALERVAEQVRKRRLQLYPPFHDFDRVNNGSVTPNQFRRVLTELDLNAEVNSEECALLAAAFPHRVGREPNVDYLAFAECVYRAAGIEPHLP